MSSIEEYVKLVAPSLLDKLKIRDVTELGTDTLIHLTPSKDIKQFEPRISRRAAVTEDNKLPRTNVGLSVLATFCAYATGYQDFTDSKSGRYTILGLKAEKVAEPPVKLVYDAKQTRELWILGYDDKHRQIAPETLGEFFIGEVSTVRRKTEDDSVSYIHNKVLYFKVDKELWLDGHGAKKQTLTPGYYRVAVKDELTRESWKDDTVVDVSEITQTEYRNLFKEMGHERKRKLDGW